MKNKKSVLHLFHGRWSKEEPMLGQGFDGQSILCDNIVFTHGTIRIFDHPADPIDMEIQDGMIATWLNGKKAYFSDFYFGAICPSIEGRRIRDCQTFSDFALSQMKHSISTAQNNNHDSNTSN